MNQPRADNSPSNANWVTSLPPGWHLKRRGPRQDVGSVGSEQVSPAPQFQWPSESIAPVGPIASEPITENSAPEEFHPVGLGSDLEEAAFHSILQQADLAGTGSCPLSDREASVATARPAFSDPGPSVNVSSDVTRVDPTHSDVSEISVSDSGLLTTLEQIAPDGRSNSFDGESVSSKLQVDAAAASRLSPSSTAPILNSGIFSLARTSGPRIQPAAIAPQILESWAVSDTISPVTNAVPIAMDRPSPEVDDSSRFASASAGMAEIPEPVSNGTAGFDFKFVDPPKRKRVVEKPKPELERTGFQAFTHRWFGPDTIGSYSLSTAFHLAIALVLSVVVFHRGAEKEGMGGTSTLIGQNAEGFGDGPLDATAINIEPTGGKGEELVADLLAAQSMSDLASNSPLGIGDHGPMAGGGGKSGQGNGQGSGVGDGLSIGGYSMAGNAVKKGSFTVWTVPTDPLPREPYLIVIQVQYKKPEQKIVQADITGMVRGTDRYERRISPKTTRIIPEANQVVIEIPGALERVQDTILVHSAILRESQRLQIIF